METVSTIAGERLFLERTPGVHFSLLRRHPDGGLTFLLRMDPGARAERHGHPGGEETYILEGSLRIDHRVDADGKPQPDLLLRAGDHAFVPANEVHEGDSADGCLFLVVAPGGIAKPR